MWEVVNEMKATSFGQIQDFKIIVVFVRCCFPDICLKRSSLYIPVMFDFILYLNILFWLNFIASHFTKLQFGDENLLFGLQPISSYIYFFNISNILKPIVFNAKYTCLNINNFYNPLKKSQITQNMVRKRSASLYKSKVLKEI